MFRVDAIAIGIGGANLLEGFRVCLEDALFWLARLQAASAPVQGRSFGNAELAALNMQAASFCKQRTF